MLDEFRTVNWMEIERELRYLAVSFLDMKKATSELS
jgi:hypothetical protein